MSHGSTAIRTDVDYQRVLDATRTYREELVVQLAGAVGLTPAEMTSFSLADARQVSRDGRDRRLLEVGEGTDERLASVPASVWSAIEKYAAERNPGRTEPILSVSDRRIQMLVAEIGDRVADLSVSSRSLRRWHAHRLLQGGVAPRIVRSIVAYDSIDTVIDRSAPPSERDVVAAMRAVEGGDEGTNRGNGMPGDERVRTALDATLAVSRAIEGAESRSEIEAAACEALVDAGYIGAWIRSPSAETARSIRTGAGVYPDRLDEDPSPIPTDGSDSVRELGPADASTTEEAVVERRRRLPLDSGRQTDARILVVPLHRAGTTHGTVSVATTEAGFSDRERVVLIDLGRRVGRAIAAAATRRLLHADSVVELEFRIADRGDFLVDIARECGCSFALEGLVPLADRGVVSYVSIDGTAAESVVERATAIDGVERSRLVRSSGSNSVVEIAVRGASVLVTLTGLGGTVTEYSVDENGGAVTVEVPTDVDVRGVVETVSAAFSESTFVAKRERADPVRAPGSPGGATSDLTEKQRSVLRAAYLAGYFDWPRETTAEELADALDISSPTLHNHLRKAQQTVFDHLLSEDESSSWTVLSGESVD